MLAEANAPSTFRCVNDAPSVMDFSRVEILAELDRVSTASLRKKRALAKMLRFVVEATLDGKTAFLKEYTIATLVFDKKDNFDPRMTSLVRTQAHKLREVLIEHYRSNPKSHGPWLWIPTGSYKAVFHHDPSSHLRGAKAVAASEPADRTPSGIPIAEPIVLSRGSDLSGVARVIAQFYREHPAWTDGWPFLPENFGVAPDCNPGAADRLSPRGGEVQHTIVELDQGLLLTAYLLAGKGGSVLYGHSFSVSWKGDVAAVTPQICEQLSSFVVNCRKVLAACLFPMAHSATREESGRVSGPSEAIDAMLPRAGGSDVGPVCIPDESHRYVAL